jgi:hypothetical protein
VILVCSARKAVQRRRQAIDDIIDAIVDEESSLSHPPSIISSMPYLKSLATLRLLHAHHVKLSMK